MVRAIRDGFLVGLFVIGGQLVYKLYPANFTTLMLGGVLVLFFYRKLDRIEAALSEERRRQDFARRQAGAAARVAAVVVALILCAAGSYAVWKWLPSVG